MSKIWSIWVLLALFVACTPVYDLQEVDYDGPYLLNEDIELKIGQSQEAWRFQSAATDYAEKGSYAESLLAWDQDYLDEIPELNLKELAEDSLAFFESYRPRRALPFILELAKDRRIVIINEAHHFPKARVFTRSLLEGLKDLGFRHLGLEALDHADSSINKRGFPVQKSGFYTREPQFGNMLRDAIQMGYQLFPYEAQGDENGPERELAQATQIASYLASHPEAKILIHCGFAHAYKGDYPAWEKAMAGRLQEMTGLEPLCIDQQAYRERSEKRFEAKDYRFQHVGFPTVYLDSLGQGFKLPRNADFVDVVVFHERTEWREGRPQWLFGPKYQPVSLDLSTVDMEPPFVVG
ncbi:MAG: hypothetical protein AAF804_20385, partial [Bacteroidota bacterium]